MDFSHIFSPLSVWPYSSHQIVVSPLNAGWWAAGTIQIAYDFVQEAIGQTHSLALTIPLLIVKWGSRIPELSGCDFKAQSWEL